MKAVILLIALVISTATWADGGNSPQQATYKNPTEMMLEKDAKAFMEDFERTLKKANYEAVQDGIVKEAGPSYSFSVRYRAKAGFQFKPIQRYHRGGLSSLDAANVAMETWVGPRKKKGAVILNANVRPVPPSAYEIFIDYAYPLRAKTK